jgi:uncharacterized protein YbjT (DUF2867 family)
MKILLTGSTGYIGRRLLPVLLDAGHRVVCLVRQRRKLDLAVFTPAQRQLIEVVEGDLLEGQSPDAIPKDIHVAFYLVHSMSGGSADFQQSEATSAGNFVSMVNGTSAQQIIYLGGIVNDEGLSQHLTSRKGVEDILAKSTVPLTVLRAAIIIGSGSASFEIIRDLVEKLPLMVAPRWLKTRCQPIAIRNVLEYLVGVMLKPEALGQTFDIGGTEILTYKEMLLTYAHVRQLKRTIITVPVLTPRLSSLWLALVTSTSYALARALVGSMTNEVVAQDERIRAIVDTKLFSYTEALQLAFEKISHRNVVSSWRDANYLPRRDRESGDNLEVPTHGVLTDKREVAFTRPAEEVIQNIWSLGGRQGWYAGNLLWRIRGLADTLVGGVGLRRGRRSEHDLKTGDALDFWRVLLADKAAGRLILYAEMRLPGEAWLEFTIKQQGDKKALVQTATFRPLGIWGRLYWYSVLPFHGLIFPRLSRRLVAFDQERAI